MADPNVVMVEEVVTIAAPLPHRTSYQPILQYVASLGFAIGDHGGILTLIIFVPSCILSGSELDVAMRKIGRIRTFSSCLILMARLNRRTISGTAGSQVKRVICQLKYRDMLTQYRHRHFDVTLWTLMVLFSCCTGWNTHCQRDANRDDQQFTVKDSKSEYE